MSNAFANLAHRGAAVLNLGLKPLGIQVSRSKHLREPWGSDLAFLEHLERVRPYTMMEPTRLYVLFQFSRYARTLAEGDSAEVGAWRGGSSLLMATLGKPRKHFVFDTFEGLPSGDDSIAKGSFADTSAQKVADLLEPLGNSSVYKGLFPTTAGPIESRKFALVHLDVDLYEGTDLGLKFFYPRTVPGGVIVIDDYGSRHQGVTRAADEFARQQQVEIMSFARGQGVILKPPGQPSGTP